MRRMPMARPALAPPERPEWVEVASVEGLEVEDAAAGSEVAEAARVAIVWCVDLSL